MSQINRILPLDFRKIFAKNVKSERLRLELSQLELAKKLGLSSGSAILAWEKTDIEDGLPRMLGFAEMCELFQRTPNDMLMVDLSGLPPPPKLAPVQLAPVGEALTTEGLTSSSGGRGQPATASPPGIQIEMKALERTVLDAVVKMRQLQDAVEHQGSNFDK